MRLRYSKSSRVTVAWAAQAVSAEHGLGKRKSGYLALQYAPEDIEKMRAVKRRLDPANILGRGTLWPAG